MRSGTYLCQFLRVFLPIFGYPITIILSISIIRFLDIRNSIHDLKIALWISSHGFMISKIGFECIYNFEYA